MPEKTAQIYPLGKIDIHQREKRYLQALAILETDDIILGDNKQLIIQFLRDCALGKTLLGRSKKRIGAGRCLKYLGLLKFISSSMAKPFNDINQSDMEQFVEKLEGNRIVKRNGQPFSEATKCDIKKTIKKFWKWKDGKNKVYPELVEWIDTFETSQDVPAIRKEEVERMIEFAPSVRNKALLLVLFDSGARIEELLNVRLKPEHVFWKEEAKCFKLRLEFSKTKPRTISVPLCTRLLDEWLKIHPHKGNPGAQLFPMAYGAVKMVLKRLGEKALSKRVTPHMLRHSSVTYYASRLKNRYQLCYRYGWAMSSKVVDRYLDREGIMEEETSLLVRTDEIMMASKENQRLQDNLLQLQASYSEVIGQMDELKQKLNAIEGGKGIMQLLMKLKVEENKSNHSLEQSGSQVLKLRTIRKDVEEGAKDLKLKLGSKVKQG